MKQQTTNSTHVDTKKVELSTIKTSEQTAHVDVSKIPVETLEQRLIKQFTTHVQVLFSELTKTRQFITGERIESKQFSTLQVFCGNLLYAPFNNVFGANKTFLTVETFAKVKKENVFNAGKVWKSLTYIVKIPVAGGYIQNVARTGLCFFASPIDKVLDNKARVELNRVALNMRASEQSPVK